mmetsp:Transcript_17511/g.36462  ORF Transcript_17511/g.36462 Transcript_17511/m.36462 type:complete len:296 (+) Transcript_17511:160-1047(+)
MNSQHAESCQKLSEKSKNSKSTCDLKVKSRFGSLIEDFPSFPRREALRKSLSKERWRLGPRQVGVLNDDIEDEMMDSFQELRPENTFVYCGPHRRAATYTHVKDFNDSASSSITMGSFVDSYVSGFETPDILDDSISKESSERGKLMGVTTSIQRPGNRRPCLGDELRSKFISSTSHSKLGSSTSQATAADSFASGITGLTSFLTGVDDGMYDSSSTSTSDALLAIKAGFMGVNDSCSLNVARGVPLNRQLHEQEQTERFQSVTDDESNTKSKAEAMLRLIQGRNRTGKRRGYNG